MAFGHFLEVEPDDFDRTVAITFTGAVNLVRAALPELRATAGVLVATSSIMAGMPLPAFSSYAAAKHALRGFLTTLQIEEREQRTGVRVAMVSPGPVNTPIYGRATSGSGRAPATLPDAYDADEVAAVLVEAALAPRHERIVGGESSSSTTSTGTRARRPSCCCSSSTAGSAPARPPASEPGALWEPMAEARVADGIPSRASGDVLALARHVGGAAARAVRTAPELLRPVPERRAR